MSIIDEVDEVSAEPIVPATVMSIPTKGHPAGSLKKSSRQSYLRVVGFVARADREFTDLEYAMLADIAEEIGLPREEANVTMEFAKNPNENMLKKDLSVVKGSSVAPLAVLDMFRLAHSDRSLHRNNDASIREEKAIELLASKHLEIQTSAGINALNQIARAAIDKDVNATTQSIASLASHGFIPGQFQFLKDNLWKGREELKEEKETKNWFIAQSNQAEDSTEKGIFAEIPCSVSDTSTDGSNTESERPTEPSAATILRNKIVAEVQQELLSQIAAFGNAVGKLQKGCGKEQKKNLERLKSIVDEESQKVSELRMVLAFVGVMKAGKSTTINAIVGADVLPERTDPMTTLPTLVTHTAGQDEPVLKFKKSAPFNQAIKNIHEDLKKAGNRDRMANLGLDDVVQRICDGQLGAIEATYSGADEICKLMTDINDVVRICRELEIENPLDAYSSIVDFPEIEVEFTYLKDRAKDGVGRLSLLDTPGPNEARQAMRLKGVVKDQLAKASTVVCVIDPSQADGEAQNELRTWIRQAQEDSGVPLFVLVNKFDQIKAKDRNQTYYENVARRVFPNVKDKSGQQHTVEGQTFAISASDARLSNLVSRALATRGQLPAGESWVIDFCKEAYGCDDSTYTGVSDKAVKQHLAKSTSLWTRSRMATPMESIVTASLKQAAQFCLNRAVDTISRQINELKTTTKTSLSAMEKKINELKEIIRELSDGLQALEDAKSRVEDHKKEAINKVTRQLIDALHSFKAETENILNKCARAEQQKQVELKKKIEAENKARRNIFSIIFDRKNNDNITKVFGSDEPIEFCDDNSAQDFLKKTRVTIEQALSKDIAGVLSELKTVVEDIQAKLKEAVNRDITSVVENMQNRLKKQLDVKVDPPQLAFPKVHMDLDLAACGTAKAHTETRTYHERHWYSLWLIKHEHSYQTTRYKVDPVKVRADIIRKIELSVNDAEKSIRGYLDGDFSKSIDSFFVELHGVFRRINDTVEDAICMKGESRETQEAAKAELNAIYEDTDRLAKRLEKLRKRIGDACPAA